MTTERLYYTDCYLRDFEARVLQAEPGPQGLRVYLDRSAFYPESGGQPSDRGTLAGIPVLDVIDEGDQVAHVLASKRERGPPDLLRQSRPARECQRGYRGLRAGRPIRDRTRCGRDRLEGPVARAQPGAPVLRSPAGSSLYSRAVPSSSVVS